jgi:hypothetical protein
MESIKPEKNVNKTLLYRTKTINPYSHKTFGTFVPPQNEHIPQAVTQIPQVICEFLTANIGVHTEEIARTHRHTISIKDYESFFLVTYTDNEMFETDDEKKMSPEDIKHLKKKYATINELSENEQNELKQIAKTKNKITAVRIFKHPFRIENLTGERIHTPLSDLYHIFKMGNDEIFDEFAQEVLLYAFRLGDNNVDPAIMEDAYLRSEMVDAGLLE